MSGHTPGPLVAVREPSHSLDGLWMVSLAGEITTCTASYCTEADAKLYAAAPELLETLKSLLRDYGLAKDARDRAEARARVAIAKAEGRA